MEKVVETMSDTSHIYGAWFWVFQCNAARSQGWVAVAIHGVGIQPFNLRFAVSAGSNPLPLESPNWEVDYLSVGESDFDTDFPTLGMDKNGYYVGVHLYKTISNPTEWKQKVVAIKKPSNCGAINFTNEVDYPATGLSGLSGTTQGGSYRWLILQPVVNFDSTITSSAPAWFLATVLMQENHNTAYNCRSRATAAASARPSRMA